MLILSRKQFLAMPAGTVYAKFEDDNGHIEQLEIKWDSLIHDDDGDGDWVNQTLEPQFVGWDDASHFFNSLRRLEDDHTLSLPIDYDCCGRDGLFDRDQKFAVWEPADLDALIDRLVMARAQATGIPE